LILSVKIVLYDTYRCRASRFFPISVGLRKYPIRRWHVIGRYMAHIRDGEAGRRFEASPPPWSQETRYSVYDFSRQRWRGTGLPDFLGAWYQNLKKWPKLNTKCTKWSSNIPNVRKIFQIAEKLINTFQSKALQNLQWLGFFGLKINHLATLTRDLLKRGVGIKWLREAGGINKPSLKIPS
jgi:hypothetical protein